MAYCKRMMRPCTCGKLSIYDRNGQLPDLDNGRRCLTDNEVRSVLTILLQEWQVRFGDAKGASASSRALLW
jgi:hypothetical protein